MTEGSWCSGRSKNGALQVVGCVLAAFLFVTPGGASTWTVNDLEDAIDIDPGDGMCETASGTCSLRAAVMEANARPGDDIVIVSEGIHRLTIASGSGAAGGALEITEDLLIIGFGAGRTVVDASVTGTAFVVARSGSEPVQATLQRLTVTGATSGALFVDSGESLVLDHAEVRGNSSLSGGGLYVRGEVELDGTVVRDNEATGSGGGVFVSSGGTLRITGGSRIEANRAGDHGGGVYADGVVLVYDGAFLRNSAGASGGGICVTNVGGLSIAGNPARPLFSHNTAGGNGGGVYSWTEGPMARLIRWTDFVANISEGEGGGLEAVGAHEISGCAFRDNVAEGAGGGGARIDGSSVTASEFSGNRSSGPGSGLAVETDTLIVNCTVHGNLSGFNGAVHVAPGAWVTMRACTVTRNEGGGVLNNGALEPAGSISTGMTAAC